MIIPRRRGPTMTSPLRRPSRRLAWLALAAMLLVFVGPLISQMQRLVMIDGMPQAQAGLDDAAVLLAAPGGGPAVRPTTHHSADRPAPYDAPRTSSVGHHRHHQKGATPDTGSHRGNHHDLSACGYCVLFAHVPGQAVALALPASAPVPVGSLAALPAPAAQPSSTYPAFTARAPPASSRA